MGLEETTTLLLIMGDSTARQRKKTFLFLVGQVMHKSFKDRLGILLDQFTTNPMVPAEIHTFAKLMVDLQLLTNLVTREKRSKDKSESTIGSMGMKKPGISISRLNMALHSLDLRSQINRGLCEAKRLKQKSRNLPEFLTLAGINQNLPSVIQ